MARAFTAADIAQANSGTDATPVASPSLALGSGTTAGRSGIIVVQAGATLEAPEHWHRVAYQSVVAIMCRADLPAGETTWPFSAVGGGATPWLWLVEEWTNLSFAPLAALGVNAGPSFQPASMTLGPTDTTDAPYVKAVAAVAMTTSGGSVWPTVSWSDGFTETNVLTVGTGEVSGNMRLHVARRYGAQGETGPFQTTATFGGSVTNKTMYGALAVFRAENHVGDI